MVNMKARQAERLDHNNNDYDPTPARRRNTWIAIERTTSWSST